MYAAFVREPAERDVRQPLELLGDARANVRMAVAMRGRPPRGGPVDELATIAQHEPAAARGGDRERRRSGLVLAVRTPDERAAFSKPG